MSGSSTTSTGTCQQSETPRNLYNDSRCKKHSSCPNQLELAALHRHLRQEAVNVVDREEESFPLKFVLLGHFNEPVDEDAAHSQGHVLLAPHEVGARSVLVLKHQAGGAIGCTASRPHVAQLNKSQSPHQLISDHNRNTLFKGKCHYMTTTGISG